MNAIEICKQVVKDHQCLYFREKKTSEKGKRDYQISYDNDIYDEVSEDMEGLAMREDLTPKKGKGWTILDAVTANTVMTVHKACKPHQQEKLETFCIFTVIDFAWKCVK